MQGWREQFGDLVDFEFEPSWSLRFSGLEEQAWVKLKIIKNLRQQGLKKDLEEKIF